MAQRRGRRKEGNKEEREERERDRLALGKEKRDSHYMVSQRVIFYPSEAIGCGQFASIILYLLLFHQSPWYTRVSMVLSPGCTWWVFSL